MHCYRRLECAEWFSRAHYPSIVICQRDSVSFQTCMNMGLKQLDLLTNNILRWDQATGELLCATKLRKLPQQKFSHEVYIEIMLADTSVKITEGTQINVEKRESGSTHKSFIQCRACDNNIYQE
ncbi:hypothetical protein PMAYCL1PPCAC_28715 [Pristionchus mayeri]|uniref:Uncharacterized protein n=1 Tax=Pristionchus mayeri TaxID=1317129 RepID=A0AAN5D9F4_9BILA|nr:hypothetical protein PMAYCL1PPCAC_28715 [Pristionchus mayeri]